MVRENREKKSLKWIACIFKPWIQRPPHAEQSRINSAVNITLITGVLPLRWHFLLRCGTIINELMLCLLPAGYLQFLTWVIVTPQPCLHLRFIYTSSNLYVYDKYQRKGKNYPRSKSVNTYHCHNNRRFCLAGFQVWNQILFGYVEKHQ